ncbi:hypothetical protein NQZ68_017800 [Dissostichus eleginoides]|nr:hypothetical protein NQZ68_017800 [Dissostichus eleginoides]
MIINNEVSIFDEKKFNTTVQTAEPASDDSIASMTGEPNWCLQPQGRASQLERSAERSACSLVRQSCSVSEDMEEENREKAKDQ